MPISDAKRAFLRQKEAAKRRGIGWELTFEQWLEFWGDDLPRRGRGWNELGMQRPCDSGPYAVGNIRKGTPADNARTRSAMRPRTVGVRSAGAVHPAKGWRPEAEDEPNLGYASAWDAFYG